MNCIGAIEMRSAMQVKYLIGGIRNDVAMG